MLPEHLQHACEGAKHRRQEGGGARRRRARRRRGEGCWESACCRRSLLTCCSYLACAAAQGTGCSEAALAGVRTLARRGRACFAWYSAMAPCISDNAKSKAPSGPASPALAQFPCSGR